MSARLPAVAELAEIARRFRLTLDPDDLVSFQGLIRASLASYDVIDRLQDPRAPVRYPRSPGERPRPEENPFGAWYWRTSIKGAPTGPLAGKRVVIKDNTCVAGVPMMNGSRTLEGFVPNEDATVVTRLLDAGAEIVGKAVCEDLCFSGGSHTPATGPVRNPWDPKRSAGGSSNGSAVLVAIGQADLALGGDQGGSVRIPSAFCGTVGMKPTHGLVPYTGAFPIELTLDHLGPIARTVRDVALMLGVIAGPDGQDPRQDPGITIDDYVSHLDEGIHDLRVGVIKEAFGWPGLSEPDVDESVREAAQRLTEAGAKVDEVSVPEHLNGIHIWNVIAIEGATNQMVNLSGYGMNWKGHYSQQLIEAFHAGRLAHANDLSETVKLVMLMGQFLIDEYGGRYYARARNLAPVLTAAYDRALADHDVLVLPTLPLKATPIPGPEAPREEYVARALEMIPNTAPFDVTGHPAMTVPAGMTDGLPVGLMIVGRRVDEATVLRVGHAFEQIVGGFPSPAGARQAAGRGRVGEQE